MQTHNALPVVTLRAANMVQLHDISGIENCTIGDVSGDCTRNYRSQRVRKSASSSSQRRNRPSSVEVYTAGEVKVDGKKKRETVNVCNALRCLVAYLTWERFPWPESLVTRGSCWPSFIGRAEKIGLLGVRFYVEFSLRKTKVLGKTCTLYLRFLYGIDCSRLIT